MPEIKELYKNIYLVGGVLVRAMDEGMFQDELGRVELCHLAHDAAEGDIACRHHGELSVFGFAWNRDPKYPCVKYAGVGMWHAMDLPDEAKAALLKEVPEYEGKI